MADIPGCGDTVRHRPTGEDWLVAYADPARDELAWCGWPPGTAKLSDCELVARCSDAEHAALVLPVLGVSAVVVAVREARWRRRAAVAFCRQLDGATAERAQGGGA